MVRIIAHLDMDAFFAAVEERDNPRFAGFPIVVGADPKEGNGRGVVSTANYKARKFGIHSAMPISTAWRLADIGVKKGGKKTVFLPVNGAWYSEVSKRIFTIVCKFSPKVEQVSIDEAYLDLSYLIDLNKAKEKMGQLKNEMYHQERLTATVGIGPNKLIAKLASSQFKPDGLYVVSSQEITQFLESLHLEDIPGIGPKTLEHLRKVKITSMYELKQKSETELRSLFGKWGEDLYRKVRGIDDSEITLEREIKSISEQETFEEDVRSATILLGRIEEIAKRVFQRIKSEHIKGFKTVTIMVRFSDFTTKTRSQTLSQSTLSEKILEKESFKLFLPFLDARQNPQKKAFRLLGVGVSNFKGEKQEESQRSTSYTQIGLFSS
ncbi:DNA polymerase IV [Candidatus Gottesmanbacteria bacterium]|nr:DNA polymerase IV [Candidatus Gottesmanbacteria bacterium]